MDNFFELQKNFQNSISVFFCYVHFTQNYKLFIFGWPTYPNIGLKKFCIVQFTPGSKIIRYPFYPRFFILPGVHFAPLTPNREKGGRGRNGPQNILCLEWFGGKMDPINFGAHFAPPPFSFFFNKIILKNNKILKIILQFFFCQFYPIKNFFIFLWKYKKNIYSPCPLYPNI